MQSCSFVSWRSLIFIATPHLTPSGSRILNFQFSIRYIRVRPTCWRSSISIWFVPFVFFDVVLIFQFPNPLFVLVFRIFRIFRCYINSPIPQFLIWFSPFRLFRCWPFSVAANPSPILKFLTFLVSFVFFDVQSSPPPCFHFSPFTSLHIRTIQYIRVRSTCWRSLIIIASPHFAPSGQRIINCQFQFDSFLPYF